MMISIQRAHSPVRALTLTFLQGSWWVPTVVADRARAARTRTNVHTDTPRMYGYARYRHWSCWMCGMVAKGPILQSHWHGWGASRCNAEERAAVDSSDTLRACLCVLALVHGTEHMHVY